MNLPNKLTVLRLYLVPVFVVVGMLTKAADGTGGVIPFVLGSILSVGIFILASLTDMLDGKLARKYNLITDFGKFLDPLADKFMVIGAFMVILYKYSGLRWIFIYAVMIVIFRELAVTSLRLIASSNGGVVIAADMLGKIKTVTQIICVCTIYIEPLLYRIPGLSELSWVQKLAEWVPLSYTTIFLMSLFTLWSGIHYMVSGWKYLKPGK